MKLKGALRRSFLERNQIIIGLIGIALVFGGSAMALLLSGGFFEAKYKVNAVFTDAAGIKGGDDVVVAGLEAGSVDSVEIKDGYVIVGLNVNKGVKMPADTRAEITVETLMGKKSVMLTGGSDDELLADGDTIPVERTRTPVELLDLANTSVPLLEESDADALEAFLEDITQVARGKREEVSTLIDGLVNVTRAVDTRSQELERLLDSLATVGNTFEERDDTIVSLIDSLDVVLANLEERSADVQRLLETTELASMEVADLVGRNRQELNLALGSLHTTLLTLNDHQTDLAATIHYLEDAVKGYSSVGYSQGTPNRWANIFVQSLGPLGIDSFFGPCGAFDQALDDLLGPDPRPCDERAEYGDPEEGGGGDAPAARGSQPGGPREPNDDDILPGDIGDILDSVTGETSLVDGLRSEVL